MQITKLIPKNKDDARGRKNFYGVLEDGKQVDLQLVGHLLTLLHFDDGDKWCFNQYWSKDLAEKEGLELSEAVRQELRDLYYVSNV